MEKDDIFLSPRDYLGVKAIEIHHRLPVDYVQHYLMNMLVGWYKMGVQKLSQRL
jgi:hypothetical protein